MTVSDALANIGNRTDLEILLAHLLRCERTWVMAHPEEALTKDEEHQWALITERRRRGEPVSYITGTQFFYGRLFLVNPSVLIPRPATERLVEIALSVLRGEKNPRVTDIDTEIVTFVDIWGELASVKTVCDIGTGSGCIAITIACERTDLRVVATDISRDALNVAKENAKNLGVLDRVEFREGRGLDPLQNLDQPFLIVTNPPYIPEGTPLMRDVSEFEPHEALFAGSDGMDVVRDILEGAKKHPMCVGVVVECRKEQVIDNERRNK